MSLGQWSPAIGLRTHFSDWKKHPLASLEGTNNPLPFGDSGTDSFWVSQEFEGSMAEPGHSQLRFREPANPRPHSESGKRMSPFFPVNVFCCKLHTLMRKVKGKFPTEGLWKENLAVISPAFLILAALPFKVTRSTLGLESPGKHSAPVLGVDWSLRFRATPLLVSLKAS